MLRTTVWASIVAYLIVDAFHLQPLIYVLKVGIMLLILAIAARQLRGNPAPGYGRAVIAGLLCSLVGDLLLTLPQDLFVPGLVFFLIAHVCYIVALSIAGARAQWQIGAGVALAGGLLFSYLAGGLRTHGQAGLLVPVAVYSLVISVMLWQALTTLRLRGPLPLIPSVVATAAGLFYLSDAILAWNKFVAPVPAHNFFIMATYFAAQYGFAASVAPVKR